MSYKNIEDQRAFDRKHYRDNPSRQEQIRANNLRSQNKTRTKILDYLEDHPCIVCGETDPVVLDFDHRDMDTKCHTVANMIKSYGWTKIKEEIDKCDVRCANCHRRRTAVQMNSWRIRPLRRRERL